tara:strand:+ start:2393 stop:3055 length:663 start_codon:yes stop_codon:yes gene_type:complete
MIVAKNIIKEFGSPPQRILHDLSFEISDGEFVAISGRSGSGKSTLLYILSTLDLPTFGSLSIDNEDIALMSSERIHAFRNKHVGFIFQFHYLLPELTGVENVLLAPRNLNLHHQYQQKAIGLLKMMDVFHVAHKLPNQMSGGEQQRVAIARALIMDPQYIFADEPTGNLDSANGEIVMSILKKINKENNTTVCLVTHEPEFSAMADREIFLVDGKISNRD